MNKEMMHILFMIFLVSRPAASAAGRDTFSFFEMLFWLYILLLFFDLFYSRAAQHRLQRIAAQPLRHTPVIQEAHNNDKSTSPLTRTRFED